MIHLPCMKRLTLLLFALALLSAALADDIPDPDTLPEKVQKGDMDPEYPAEMARRLRDGKAFLENGELEKAQEELARAEKAALHQMVYFYQAVVAYRLGDYPRALQRANEGLGVLSDIRSYGDPTPETAAQEQRFGELRDAIQAKLDATGGKAGPDPRRVRQEFEAAEQEANEAFAQGLPAKAANAYARAFRLDPTRGELGLRAATLYADRLNNPLEAARLWQQVLAGGEPHASAARLELQSHRDVLDGVLQAGLAKRQRWRGQGPAEALQLAEAFPESTDLQVEIALIHAFKGQVDAMIEHLQAASRLGMGLDEFRAQRDFLNFFEVSGVDTPAGRRLASFLRDAYGDETIMATLRTEVKRRADERVRLEREKAEKERQARIAAEFKELDAWRSAERRKVVAEAGQLLNRHNGIEVEVLYLPPPVTKSQSKPRNLATNSTQFSWDGRVYDLHWELNNRSVRRNGAVNGYDRSERYTFASTASFAAINVKPSTWLQLYVDGDFQVVEPYRALCRLVEISFRNQVVRQQTDWHDLGNDPSPRRTATTSTATINVMLTDAEVARLQWLFARLSQLDGAGDNVGKLRQLRQ